MFGLLFVLTTLGAEPAETTSLATCVRPAAKLAAPKIEHVAGAARSTDCHQIAVWLRRWEQTARRRPALSTARRDALRHKVETDANAHAAMALELMTGPLDITRLRESFAWTITDRDAGRIQLEAIPRDDTERLFYTSIRVWLDENDGALNQLRVTDRSGETCFVWRNNAAPEPSPIQFVSAIEEAASLIIADELPSPLSTSPTIDAAADEHDCANTPGTSPESSTSSVEPHEQSARLFAWLFNPPAPGLATTDPTDLSMVTPELDATLSQWAAAARERKTVHVDFTRTVYNSVFEMEKRSEGQLAYQTPQSMTVVLRGARPARGEISLRLGNSGNRYRIDADRSETWVWTDHEVVLANDEDKTYEVAALPPASEPSRGRKPLSWLHNTPHFYSPFVFDIDAEQLRLEWSLEMKKHAGGVAVIEATPRTAMLKSRYGRCVVRLDTRDWRPTSVNYIDRTGTLETIYLVRNWRSNPARPNGRNLRPGFNNFKARGYKLIAHP